ncbi:MAG: hypothetical protein MI750_01065 [Xanthomonadales bacterium]|nr:hypothetical protein [Xanthomonadales bacterium]
MNNKPTSISEVNPDDIHLELMSYGLRDLVRVVGVTSFLTLVKHWPGQRINIPQSRLTHLSKLRHVLTTDVLNALAKAYGGTTIDLPTEDKVLLMARDSIIVRTINEQSLTNNDAAKLFGVSRRHIIRIRQKMSTVQRPATDLFLSRG